MTLAAPKGAAATGFDPTSLSVVANEPIELDFNNQDPGIQHNVVIFSEDPADNPDAKEVFSGALVTGAAEAKYDVPPLAPGTFFFHCVVHPTTMIGTIDSAEGGGEGGGGGGGGGTTVVAKDLAFDTDQIDLTAGQPTTLTFDNEDAGIPHNIAIYSDDSLSETLFQGTQFPGIASRGVSDPGARCGDVLLPLRRPHHDERHGGGRSGRGLGSRAANRRRTPPARPVPPAEPFAAPLLAWSTWAADTSSSPPQWRSRCPRPPARAAARTTGRRTSSERRRWTSPPPRWPATPSDGQPLALADLRGNVVVVNFWATWCDPCRDEQPELVGLADDYRAKGVEFLGVNERDDTAKARAWIEEFDVPYPSIVDEPGAWADDFAFFGLPDTYVIDRRGHRSAGPSTGRPTRRS